MKKIYMQPVVNVQKVEIEAILAASEPIGASNDFNNDNELDENQIESKKYGNVSFWNEDEL